MTALAMPEATKPQTEDATRQLRRTLGCYPTGVTVVTTRAPDGRPVGLTVNSFASLSLTPPLLLWSLSNRSPNLRAFKGATHFAINVLAHGQDELAMRFANPAVPDKFEGVALHSGDEQAALAPLIEGSLAWFVCEGRDAIETGDHTLFIGRIVRHTAHGGRPLVFHAGAFARLEQA